MRKFLSLALVIVLVSCSKQNTIKKEPLTSEVRQQMINAALNTINENRLTIANSILLADPASKGTFLKKVIATNQKTGVKSFGYLVIESYSSGNNQVAFLVAPGWGIYTGWMLGNDGCWHHGTFVWSGNPGNYIFTEDSNPYGDNYVGNEPRCMSDDEFDSY